MAAVFTPITDRRGRIKAVTITTFDQEMRTAQVRRVSFDQAQSAKGRFDKLGIAWVEESPVPGKRRG